MNSPQQLRWPAKHPAERLDYRIDFKARLDSDAIAGDASVVLVDGGALSIDAHAVAGSAIVVWLSGGDAGTDYRLAVTVSTSAGRTMREDVAILVAS